MKIRCTLLFSTLFLLATISIAQTAGGANAFSVSTLSAGINLRSIAGAPFSADVVSQSTQILADGTPVTRETHGKMFRDSAGRTRSETELKSFAAGVEARGFVTIVDPVQGTGIVLDVAAKKATVFNLHLPAAPAATAGKLNLAAPQAGHKGIKELITPGSEELGDMMMEGFTVTGTRRTHATETGGAAKSTLPNIVTESWFSPELKVELLVTRQAPQSMNRTTRLTRITPGEPDPVLFQPPADYAVQESGQAK